jgi:recombination protein RecA
MTTTLQDALATVEEQFGPIVVSPNGEASTPPAVIPSGSVALDQALGIGGIPRGRITEVYGPEGVGKTTLALSVLAQAQRAGGTGLFVDTEHAISLPWAATVGVDTHRLLLCHPDSGEQALEAVGVLVGSSAVDVVAIDSIAGLVPEVELAGRVGDQHPGAQGNLLSLALRKLVGPVARAGVALVVTNQLRQRAGVAGTPTYTAGGRALGYYASVRLHLHQPRDLTRRGQVVGRRVAGLRAGAARRLGPVLTTGALRLGKAQGTGPNGRTGRAHQARPSRTSGTTDTTDEQQESPS